MRRKNSFEDGRFKKGFDERRNTSKSTFESYDKRRNLNRDSLGRFCAIGAYYG